VAAAAEVVAGRTANIADLAAAKGQAPHVGISTRLAALAGGAAGPYEAQKRIVLRRLGGCGELIRLTEPGPGAATASTDRSAQEEPESTRRRPRSELGHHTHQRDRSPEEEEEALGCRSNVSAN
jgi:hypothetical protein